MNPAATMFGVGLALLGLSLWLERANAITNRQLSALIDFVFEQPDWFILREEMEAIGFRRHFWAVALMRDPRRLYSARLAAQIPDGRAAS